MRRQLTRIEGLAARLSDGRAPCDSARARLSAPASPMSLFVSVRTCSWSRGEAASASASLAKPVSPIRAPKRFNVSRCDSLPCPRGPASAAAPPPPKALLASPSSTISPRNRATEASENRRDCAWYSSSQRCRMEGCCSTASARAQSCLRRRAACRTRARAHQRGLCSASRVALQPPRRAHPLQHTAQSSLLLVRRRWTAPRPVHRRTRGTQKCLHLGAIAGRSRCFSRGITGGQRRAPGSRLRWGWHARQYCSMCGTY